MTDNVCDLILDLVKEASVVSFRIYDLDEENYEKVKKLKDYMVYESIEITGWNDFAHDSKSVFTFDVGNRKIGDMDE